MKIKIGKKFNLSLSHLEFKETVSRLKSKCAISCEILKACNFMKIINKKLSLQFHEN